ncbi:transposase [Ruegeria hyattellae]|uniref:transposase n=1 Tax=Ruegeria hyattellae TaxID=3233337 RepID=UPI00355B26F8
MERAQRGNPKRHIWRKIHLGIDEKTVGVRAVEVTTSNVGDAPMLPELLDQTPPDQTIGTVTAAGPTKRANAMMRLPPGIHMLSTLPARTPSLGSQQAGAVARNEAAKASRYLGRARGRRWSGYHRRSRVETKTHCVKLVGQRLMARGFDRQIAEIQIRIAVLNRYTALGVPITGPVGAVPPGKKKASTPTELCNKARVTYELNGRPLHLPVKAWFDFLTNDVSSQ